MTQEEQNLISSLFDRLRRADTATKDPEAERFIRQKVAEFPAAPYLLVQSVLVLEHALANAQARIAELEKQLAAANQSQKSSSGGFLSGLFGGGRQQEKQTPPPVSQSQPPPPRAAYPPQPQAQYPPPPPTPYPSTANMQPGAGGSFLKGALSTAAGVAGGALLFQGIQNLIGHNAGPFAPMMGGGQGGFLPEDVSNTEVTNNYYINEDPQNAQDVQNVEDDDPANQGGVADQNVDYDPGQQDLDTLDDNFDVGGGDDSNYV